MPRQGALPPSGTARQKTPACRWIQEALPRKAEAGGSPPQTCSSWIVSQPARNYELIVLPHPALFKKTTKGLITAHKYAVEMRTRPVTQCSLMEASKLSAPPCFFYRNSRPDIL